MKLVTYINLSLRIITIPLILCFVHSAQDIGLYAIIVATSIVLGTLLSYVYLFTDGIRLRIVSLLRLQTFIHDATPFFATSITGYLKSFSIKTIIKHFFGVGEVAVYDLAEKIITIPRFFTQNINNALFPEVIANPTNARVRRILKYERFIGAGFTIVIALLSYPAVLILGGQEMLGATSLTILLSSTIYTCLVVGAYLNFIFIPTNHYYLITLNQVLALFSCLFLSLLGLFWWQHISMITLGLVLSGFCEIVFCRYVTRKNILL